MWYPSIRKLSDLKNINTLQPLGLTSGLVAGCQECPFLQVILVDEDSCLDLKAMFDIDFPDHHWTLLILQSHCSKSFHLARMGGW